MGARPNEPGETWRPVVGFEGRYEVSNLGRIWSLPRTIIRIDGQRQGVRGGLRRPQAEKSGHLLIDLGDRASGRLNFRRVHQLVLEAFVGPCPEGMEGCHENDDPGDNRLSNLRWDTRSGNQQDAVRNGVHRSGNSKKETCPYNHLLVAPNLTVWGLRRNMRVCLACARARAEGRRRLHRGLPVDLPDLRAAYYAAIINSAELQEAS